MILRLTRRDKLFWMTTIGAIAVISGFAPKQVEASLVTAARAKLDGVGIEAQEIKLVARGRNITASGQLEPAKKDLLESVLVRLPGSRSVDVSGISTFVAAMNAAIVNVSNDGTFKVTAVMPPHQVDLVRSMLSVELRPAVVAGNVEPQPWIGRLKEVFDAVADFQGVTVTSSNKLVSIRGNINDGYKLALLKVLLTDVFSGYRVSEQSTISPVSFESYQEQIRMLIPMTLRDRSLFGIVRKMKLASGNDTTLEIIGTTSQDFQSQVRGVFDDARFTPSANFIVKVKEK